MTKEQATGTHTGWKAAREARRPRTARLLKKHPPQLKLSKKRRAQSKNRRAAMRAQGAL